MAYEIQQSIFEILLLMFESELIHNATTLFIQEPPHELLSDVALGILRTASGY